MTITLTGHLCFDTLHLPHEEGSSARQFGGIVYSIAALAALTEESDMIVPVVGVGEADQEQFTAWLDRFPQVKTDGVYSFKGPTNDVHLFYGDAGARIECSKHIAKPIPLDKIMPFLNADGILVNMISGFDITLETLDAIRMETREKGTPVYLDAHSLTLGIDHEFRRFRRPVVDWRRWCFMIDTVQLSEDEAAGLAPEKYSEQDFIHQALSLMVRNLIITRGVRGATLLEQHNKKITRHEIPGHKLTDSPDPTGCGDVFGAAFLVEYLASGSALKAADLANKVAAYHTTYSGTENLLHARESVQNLFPV
ncbi:MAG: carbohydrate kinase family protein [Ignavibacteriales bacterium]|nr:carbohydrate kinase family protein [Ignavibacteriales bacterium]